MNHFDCEDLKGLIIPSVGFDLDEEFMPLDVPGIRRAARFHG
jgi:hypothetical protein